LAIECRILASAAKQSELPSRQQCDFYWIALALERLAMT